MTTWEPQREPQTEVRQPKLDEAPLTKRQLKCRRNKDSKLTKKFKSLDAEISNLKFQMDALKDKIMRASKSTNAGFKRKKIRSMKREADKINEKLTKSEAKLELNKDSKLTKKFKSLDAEISNLKFQMDALKDKIMRASKSTNAGFKRKKIRSMKREADKINEKLAKSEAKLESIKPRVTINPVSRVPLKLHPPNRSKRIEAKIAEINKKIRRAKNRGNKECLIAKRETLKAELNWGPRLLEGAFGGAYRRYRIDGMPGTDPDTFFGRIRRSLIDLLKKESRT